ncbi:MAG TPA: hypothetical protein VGR57_09310 [Ktedonobacterales bacterium]|nr:hypothetical protein [Ktedonobacterales bacterium]
MPSAISSFLSHFWSAFWTIEHLATLATTLVGGLIGGVAATIVAAVRLRRQAPKIAISTQIARYRVRGGETHYAIKIRNQRWFREAIDLSASLKLLRPEAKAEGILRRATHITLQQVSLVELNHNKRPAPARRSFASSSAKTRDNCWRTPTLRPSDSRTPARTNGRSIWPSG